MSIRVDEATQREIDGLTKTGKSRNAAVVDAIHQAYRQSLYEEMRETSVRLRDDPEYQAEIKAAREAIGADDAW